MAVPVIMPQRGNAATSYVIAAWKKRVGDVVRKGDVLAEVETDKAIVEVESPADGTLLALFYEPGDEAATLTNIGAVGAPGEDVAHLRGAAVSAPAEQAPVSQAAETASVAAGASSNGTAISPRARMAAASGGLDLTGVKISGSGPEGRIIERDILAALSARPPMTRMAASQAGAGDLPPTGTGIGGRVTSADIVRAGQPAAPLAVSSRPVSPDDVTFVPMKGVRKVTAERMRASLQSTAQLTMVMHADARMLKSYRAKLKASPETMGLRDISINDLVLAATARTLVDFPNVNAMLMPDGIYQHKRVALGFAVDTPRGLVVPVIRDAHALSLKALSGEAKRLAAVAQEGRLSPEDMADGTFTVTNLGSFGIESFTPVLNPPQVAILGVGAIHLKAVEQGDAVAHVPHITLSLTIDHAAVDGAPGARFLAVLAERIKHIDLVLAQ
ncbi:MAG: 2-oxo acid dehydrogenase subunit E2 [Pleurocapsa minor GSE-CHR-MK-17-07R]|nr:2-oxo acid dehydrogenase subunit E2 [Pleurocapsa minor GSE-CHR-MK 17-07R]